MTRINKEIIRKAAICAGVVLFFIVLAYSFVPQVLSGKIVNQSDISSWKGMANEAVTYNAAHPEDKTRWTDSMFGGMPTTATIDDFDGDWTKALYRFLLLGRRPASYLFIALLGAFLMFLAFGCGVLPSVAGAVAVAFCAYNMQIIQVGHNTKMQAIAFFPWVLAGVAFTYRCALGRVRSAGQNETAANHSGETDSKRKTWTEWLPQTVLGAVLFAFALSFQIKANHPQITYYLAIVIFVYALTCLVWLCVRKAGRAENLKRFFTASALLLVIGCAGIATNANKLIPTYRYAKYTMRGGSELVADKAEHAGDAKAVKEAKAAAKGLDLEYATAWSYGISEMPNLLIPDFNGGASACDPRLKKSATESLLKQYRQPNVAQTMKSLPMYWGPQPFTAGPMYLGAVSIFLFILGLFLLKGEDRRHTIWIIIATLIAVFLAWGSHFMWFTKLWFNYAPMYNKFRTVSMALTILQVTVPLLGFIALDRIVRERYDRKQVRRATLWAFGLTGGFCLLFAVFPGLAGDFSAASDEGMQDILADALREDRRAMLRRDAVRSLVFIMLAGAMILWSCRAKAAFAGKKRAFILGGVIGVMVLFDMFSVGKRYLNKEHFVTPADFDRQFAERTVDKIILEDPAVSYRVFDLSSGNPFNDAHPSYRHKSIGGYSPVKLQRYQDLIERYISREANRILSTVNSCETIREVEEKLPYLPITSMLNGRYIVLGDNYSPVVNRYAAGNCRVVSAFRQAASVNEEIELLASADLTNTAVLGPDFAFIAKRFEEMSSLDSATSHGGARSQNNGPAGGTATGTAVELRSYEPNELHYSYSSGTPSAVVFSEIYYPEGWKAWIGPAGNVGEVHRGRFTASEEAQSVELFRCNWMLRGLLMPAGDYEIVMRFEPQSYITGQRISTASSALLLLLLLLSAAGAVFSGKNCFRIRR